MQVQTNVGRPTDPTLYRNMFHALWRIGSTEGLRGLYRGLGIAVVGSGPASAAFFTSYEVRSESRGRAVDDCHRFATPTSFPRRMRARVV